MLSYFKSQAGIKTIPKDKIDKIYKRYRIQAFLAIFLGYMICYFSRMNFTFAIVPMQKSICLTKGQIGLIISFFGASYGVSKFVMGFVSDRSNPRIFLALSLILSGICNLVFPCSVNIIYMITIWFLNGWAQGMAWPSCAKILTHWFSDKERGRKMALWNISHNIGAALAPRVATLGGTIFLAFNLTHYKGYFYFPGVISIISGILYFIFSKDIPIKEGLPSIEEYKNDYPKNYANENGTEPKLKIRDVFGKYILKNKILWCVAIANVFVYVIRVGIESWMPIFLKGTHGLTDGEIKTTFMLFEFAAIPGTLLVGWVSDKIFHGKRTPVGIICLVGTTLFILIYWFTNNVYITYISASIIGALIYGPVMLIGISAIDSVPTNAAGTASGFTGLFGYLMGQVLAGAILGYTIDHFGWDGSLTLILISCALSIFFLSFTWNAHNTDENITL
ncbi:MAG: MFS transporter [Clostridia bacterium]|nr:MFS transporter [Clostridia bacterium]